MPALGVLPLGGSPCPTVEPPAPLLHAVVRTTAANAAHNPPDRTLILAKADTLPRRGVRTEVATPPVAFNGKRRRRLRSSNWATQDEDCASPRSCQRARRGLHADDPLSTQKGSAS